MKQIENNNSISRNYDKLSTNNRILALQITSNGPVTNKIRTIVR